MGRLLLALLAAAMVVGCNPDSGELSKTDDATMREKLKKGLSPEEMAQMGKTPAEPPPVKKG
ncbi:MAG: hypothetical protein ACO1SV_00495 [Fimbriimonas sp.]